MGYGGYSPGNQVAEAKTPLQQALHALPLAQAQETLDLIERLTRNVVHSPKEEKFRKIKLSNPKIAAAITNVPFAVDALKEMGWVDDEEGLMLPATTRLEHHPAVVAIIDAKAHFTKEAEVQRRREAVARKVVDPEKEELMRKMAEDRVEKKSDGPVTQDSKAKKLGDGPNLSPNIVRVERFFQVDWWKLARNKVWRDKPTELEGAPEILALAEWLQGTQPKQWPLLAKNKTSSVLEASLVSCSWSFVVFTWRRLRPVGPAVLMVIYGLMPASISFLNGLVVGVVVQKDSDYNLEERKHLLLLYSFLYWVVHQISTRTFYKFELDVPEMSLRNHLRHVVMRSLLRLQGEAAARFPPGESAAVLGECVTDAVDFLWSVLFTAIQLVTQYVTLTATIFVSVRHASLHARGLLPLFCVLIPAAKFALFFSRLRPCSDLASRQTQWELNMYGMAVEQVARSRERMSVALEAEVSQAANDFAQVAFVYRKRAFHSYFMDLVNQDTISEFSIFFQVTALVVTGLEVIDGSVGIDEFTILTSAIVALNNATDSALSILVGLPHGHAALLRIADVINSDDSHNNNNDNNNNNSHAGVEHAYGSESQSGSDTEEGSDKNICF
ncbi:unnamed protein product [Polarella glacialis]|uniref:PUB domain-containing protein n=1 Tax=Polarella glacialis TaxID=89957 RepID=A0A813GJ16_POLGL|nr:unnamed protein product [Polarella glacialis]